jgi:hypothetical protein
VLAFRRQDQQMIASLSDGTLETFDVIYPVLGCKVRSELAKKPFPTFTRSRLQQVMLPSRPPIFTTVCRAISANAYS